MTGTLAECLWIPKSLIPSKELALLKTQHTLKSRFENLDVLHTYIEQDDRIGFPRHSQSPFLHTFKYKPEIVEGKSLDVKFTGLLRTNQVGIINKLQTELSKEQSHCDLILKSETGSGKTVMFLYAWAWLNTPALVVVTKTDLVNQWIERILQFTDVTRDEIGIAQADKCDYEGKKIVIGMIHSLCKDKYPDNFKQQFGLVIFDECVSGESIIITEDGPTKIKDACDKKYVLTNDGLQDIFKPINRFLVRGEKPIIQIDLEGGLTLKCTKEHLIQTLGGWKQAGELNSTDDIKILIGQSDIDWLLRQLRYVPVGVARELMSDLWSICDLIEQKQSIIHGISADIIEHKLMVLKSLKAQCQKLLELFSEISEFTSPIEEQSKQGYHLHTVNLRKNGQNIKCGNLVFSTLDGEYKEIMASEISLSPEQVDVIHNLLNYVVYFIRTEKNELQNNFYNGYPQKESRGGFVMTGQDPLVGQGYPHMDSLMQKMKLFVTGFVKEDTTLLFKKTNVKDSGASDLELMDGIGCLAKLNNLFLPVCSTNYAKVLRINKELGEFVITYDLEINDLHWFYANGMLVHNCHRMGAHYFSAVGGMFPAKYRLGATATLRRQDGFDRVFYDHLGRNVVSSAKSEQPEPKIIVYHYDRTSGDIPDYLQDTIQRRGVLFSKLGNNKHRSRKLVQLIKDLSLSGRQTLVLSERIPQLEYIREQILDDGSFKPEEVGLYLSRTKKVEQKRIAQECRIILATVGMLSEGTDIDTLRGLVYATPLSDIEQSIGRICRVNPDMPYPVVVDVVDMTYPEARMWARKRDKFYTQKKYRQEVL